MSDPRQQLESIGGSGGAMFENQEKWVKDTAFFDPSEDITEQSFFNSDTKDSMWKTRDFPSNTMAYMVTGLSLDVQIPFDTSDIQAHKRDLDYFLRNSDLIIRHEGKDIVTLPAYVLVDYSLLPDYNPNMLSSGYDRELKAKFNNHYTLSKPIKVAAGETPEFKLVPAKGLSVPAYAAGMFPKVSKATGVSDESQAAYVKVWMKTVQSKSNR